MSRSLSTPVLGASFDMAVIPRPSLNASMVGGKHFVEDGPKQYQFPLLKANEVDGRLISDYTAEELNKLLMYSVPVELAKQDLRRCCATCFYNDLTVTGGLCKRPPMGDDACAVNDHWVWRFDTVGVLKDLKKGEQKNGVD